MNNYKIFAKLFLDNKIYLMTLINSSKVIFARYENEKVTLDLNADEFIMIKNVYNSLLINEKDAILIDNKIINQTTYNIFYDTNSGNYFWKDILGKYVNNPVDNVILNFKYNARPLGITFKNKEASSSQLKDNFYPRLVRIGKRFATLLISSSFALSMLAGCSVDTEKKVQDTLSSRSISFRELKELMGDEETTEIYSIGDNPTIAETTIQTEEPTTEKQLIYDYETIKQLIAENPNIDDNTKEFLYELRFVFDEYNQYMDLELVQERLKTLKISFDSSYNKERVDVGGIYYPTTNEIIVYKADGLDLNDEEKVELFLHEFLHVLQDNDYKYMLELSNQQFTLETLRRLVDRGVLSPYIFTGGFNNGKGYSSTTYLYRHLASILSKETLAKYQFQCKPDIIIDELAKIDNGNTTRAYSLIETFQKLKDFNGWIDNIDIPEEIKKQINYYYEKVKGISMDEDLYACMDNIPFMSSATKPLGKVLFDATGLDFKDDSEYVLASGIYSLGKSYFSDKFKDSTINFRVSKTANAREDLEIPNDKFTVVVTPELCTEYQEAVQEKAMKTNEEDQYRGR